MGHRSIGTDAPVTFSSDGIEFAASLRGPTHGEAEVPAVVIVAGSGPTDRDGNSPVPGYAGLALDTYRWLADVLAEAGWASLRFDKFGAGVTGLGPYAEDPAAVSSLSFEQLYVEPVRAALAFVAAVPGIDASRLLVLGHSEGALVALAVGNDPGTGPTPAGLALVEPQYARTLDILERQLLESLDAAPIDDAEAAALARWLCDGVDSLRAGPPASSAASPSPTEGAQVPLSDPSEPAAELQTTIAATVYGTLRTTVGASLAALDPVDLARSYRGGPVLVTAGTKDFNTPLVPDGGPGSGVAALAAALPAGTADLVVLEDTVHELRDIGERDHWEVPPAQLPDHPFSADLEATLTAFLGRLQA